MLPPLIFARSRSISTIFSAALIFPSVHLMSSSAGCISAPESCLRAFALFKFPQGLFRFFEKSPYRYSFFCPQTMHIATVSRSRKALPTMQPTSTILHCWLLALTALSRFCSTEYSWYRVMLTFHCTPQLRHARHDPQ